MIDFTLQIGPATTENIRFSSHYIPYQNSNLIQHELINAHALDLPHYPVQHFNLGTFKIIAEGAFYGIDTTQLELKLKNLFSKANSPDFNLHIKNFQNDTDGEFNLYAYEIIEKKIRFIFLNDCLGRLQTYFITQKNAFLLSRNLSQLIRLSNSPAINPWFIADTLVFGFPLDNATIHSDIHACNEGQVIDLVFDPEKGTFNLKKDHIKHDFTAQKKFTRKEEYIEHILPLLRNAIERRVSYLNNQPWCCDITGGFDSRTVFGLLHNIPNGVFTTNIKLGDETLTVKPLLNAFGCQEKLRVIDAENHPTINDFNSLLYYIQNFSGNHYANAVCWQALESQKKQLAISNRIGGIGFTDFIRKGIRNDRKSLVQTFTAFNPYGPTIPAACHLLGLSIENYTAYIENVVRTWPEKNNRDIHKRYFYLRTLILQSRLTEDRERFHYWNIHPLWDSTLCIDTLKHFNLDWRGYHIHYLLLKSIDSRLVKVPINKSYLDFENERMLRSVDFKENSRLYMRIKKTLHTLSGKQKRISEQPKPLPIDTFFTDKNVESSGNAELDYIRASYQQALMKV